MLFPEGIPRRVYAPLVRVWERYTLAKKTPDTIYMETPISPESTDITLKLMEDGRGPPLIPLKAPDHDFVFGQFQGPDQRVTLVAEASEEEQIGGGQRKSGRWRRTS